MARNFQVHLQGMIELLSQHLYSGPEVFLRELLQNGIDALTARRHLDLGFEGRLDLELSTPQGSPATLMCVDNGIGLTEDEVHQFLSTIGESSKRLLSGEGPQDFIGRFGIGLLSCFLVSDEVVVVSQSRRGGPPVEWRGRIDGTYDVRTLQGEFEAGTRVYLVARPDAAELFRLEKLRNLAQRYGSLLPYPVRVGQGEDRLQINSSSLPWREHPVNSPEWKEELLRYGERHLDGHFLDVVPLRSAIGDVEGVAFILASRQHPHARRNDTAYLRRMLISDRTEGLLPDWAFFVRAIVNANDLAPTASREQFHAAGRLDDVRECLGADLRKYLMELAEQFPDRFRTLLRVHQEAIEALAVADDECFDTFIDWLPFETSEGRLTLPEFRKRHERMHYVTDHDQFRQISPVAAARRLGLINAGYVHGESLLSKLPELRPDWNILPLDPSQLAQSLEDLTPREHEEAESFIETGLAALEEFQCDLELRRFQPVELAALFTTSEEGRFLRSLRQSKQKTTGLWSGVLENLERQPRERALNQLLLNFNHPLVRRLVRRGQGPTVEQTVRMLYVQALLQGHFPLNSREWQVMGESLDHLIQAGLNAEQEE